MYVYICVYIHIYNIRFAPGGQILVMVAITYDHRSDHGVVVVSNSDPH